MVGRNGMAMAEMFTECDQMCQKTPKFISETICGQHHSCTFFYIRTSKLNFEAQYLFYQASSVLFFMNVEKKLVLILSLYTIPFI